MNEFIKFENRRLTRMSTGLACTPSRARALYSPAFPRPRNLCIARRACANSNRVPMKTQHRRAFSIQSCLHTVNQNMPALSQEATRRTPCAIDKKGEAGQRAFRHPSQIEREISWRRREQREQRRQHPEPPLGNRGVKRIVRDQWESMRFGTWEV